MRRSKRDALVMNALPIARSVTERYRIPSHIAPRREVLAIALAGALDAASRYDPSQGTTFAQFIRPRMVGAVKDFCRNQDPLTRDHRRLVKKASKALESGTPLPEVCERVGIKPSQSYLLCEVSREPLSLHTTTAPMETAENSMDETTLMQIIRSREVTPERSLARTEMKAILDTTLEQLRPRYRRAMEFYYFGELTMKEIGTTMGVNESMVCKMIKAATAECRDILAARGIKAYDEIAA